MNSSVGLNLKQT